MTFFAITQPTADWCLGKPAVVAALADLLLDGSALKRLTNAVIVEGAMRLSADDTGTVISCWHSDYLSGTGDEKWAFMVIDEDDGFRASGEHAHETLERFLYVANQRLQGFLIDASFIHRAHVSGAHSCLSARGTLARQFSLAYFERDVRRASSLVHAIVFRGPSRDIPHVTNRVAADATKLETLVEISSRTIAPGRKAAIAPASVANNLRYRLAPYFAREVSSPATLISRELNREIPSKEERFRTAGWTYRDWMAPASHLSKTQRRLLDSFPLDEHPLRIVGPAGSGKTLLMQLLALRSVERAASTGKEIRVLYVTHNNAMTAAVRQRFGIMRGVDSIFANSDPWIEVMTLSDYGRQNLSLADHEVINDDAQESKAFQLSILDEALLELRAERPELAEEAEFFRRVMAQAEVRPVLLQLVMAEISSAIKGQGLAGDPQRYVRSERRLSRLHGVLGLPDREFLFAVFLRYQKKLADEYQVLDADDIALSLLGRLRAPLWDLKRRANGYDYVFVDETQLFNENERRVFPFLCRDTASHTPIALALDEAQDVHAYTYAGLATLGIPDLQDENLGFVHRSTPSILRLAFFALERTTDLFSADFPSYTQRAESTIGDDHALAARPALLFHNQANESFGAFVARAVRGLRESRLRRVAVVCHAEQYWEVLADALKAEGLPVQELTVRGEGVASEHPLVFLARPDVIGGQEFDACVIVGLEQGVSPPRVFDNEALEMAVEQQSLRESYVSITRARYRVVFPIRRSMVPNHFLVDAREREFVVVGQP